MAVIDFAVKMVIVVALRTLGNRTVLPSVCYIQRCVVLIGLYYLIVFIVLSAAVDIG
jgi:hypothetical protein